MARAYICDFQRTPIGRYGGALAGVRTDELAAHPIRALMARHEWIGEDAVDEVILGCANQAGEDNRNVARMAVLLSGLGERVPAYTVNRLCGSGMDAVVGAFRAIRCGEADVVIAGGVESMSRAPFVFPKAETSFSRRAEVYDTTIGWRFVNPNLEARYGIDSMPETAENVAELCGITREDQDLLALSSQRRTAQAQASGRLAREIAPITVRRGRGTSALMEADEHPRETTLEALGGLPTPFRNGGSVTAGNSSGVNDGAAALLVASEDAVVREGLAPLAEIEASTSAGVSPRLMGLGPVPAVRELCDRLGLDPGDYEIVELNEAFAAQVIAACRELDLDPMSKAVNPNGGAIALGHPLGMTGARLTGTAALQLSLRGEGRALCTLCVGVGQGLAVSLKSV